MGQELVLNRKTRRKAGFTEPRFRKTDVVTNGFNMKAYNLFHSYSRGMFPIVHNPRTQGVDGKPRRWQAEKARRRMAQIEQLVDG